MSEHKTIASIHHGDCLDVLRGMGDNSVDAVVTDPPYNIGKAAWDKIPDYDKWLSVWIAEASRVLKRQGAFWCFHSEPLQLAKIAKMIADTGRPLVNWITWDKYNAATPRWKNFLDGYTIPGALRCWQQNAEYIIYCADDGAWEKQTDEIRGFLYEPLRAYLDEERKRAGIGKDECNEACGFSRSAGGMARHYFSRSQWCLPTREHYSDMQKLFNRSGGGYLRREYEYLRREYEELRREYEELRREYEELRREYEELRPTFNGSAYQSSVWQFDPAPRNGHTTPKPVDLMRRIIEATTTPGQVVLDPFMGSGSTGVACAELGRHFIGIEREAEYVEIAKARIGGAA